MSRCKIAAAACALWLSASPVAAEPFRNFVDMCLETGGDRQAAVAVAKAAGWHPMSPDALNMGPGELQEATLHFSVDPALMTDKGPPANTEMLITGWGGEAWDIGVDGLRMETCVVGTLTGDVADLEGRLEGRLAQAPIDMDGHRIWAFTREGAGFQSAAAFFEAEEEDALRMLSGHKLYLALVIPEGDVVVMMLAAFRPDN